MEGSPPGAVGPAAPAASRSVQLLVSRASFRSTRAGWQRSSASTAVDIILTTVNQCDEGKPTCKRCEKSRRECGGYRPEFEIVHRDQTGSTVRRLRKAADSQQHQFAAARPFVFVQEEPEPWRRRHSPSPSPESALTIPLAHRASCYFASNFILVPVGVAPHGFMEYLVPLMGTEPPESALRYAFNACAFSLLGHRARADGVDLAKLSLKEHTLALAQTHKALGNPASASTDSTLAAVLLLCLYEVIIPFGFLDIQLESGLC
jgi:hypothetical protein